METSSRYAGGAEDDQSGAAARIAVYTRLSKDPDGRSVNTSIQVAECLEGVKRYARDRGLRVKVAAIFEESDISASEYSKKKRPDFRNLIELIKQNEVNVIFATEVERLVRQPAEAEQLIDLASASGLREILFTSEEGCDLLVPGGVYRLRQAVKLAERESRKTSERLRRKLADRVLGDRKRLTEVFTVAEALRRAGEANESVEWRSALIGRSIERIEVVPGLGKPYVNVDEVIMRFEKDRVKIIWRQEDSISTSAA